MPQPGDPYANAFTCAHCTQTPTWSGRWFAPSGDRWWRMWACPDYLEVSRGCDSFGGEGRTLRSTEPISQAVD
jgi:hypothetical protein